MVSSKTHYTTVIGAVALLFGGANAHGYLCKPQVSFPTDVDKTQFVATIESSASGFSGSFSGSPAENTAAFSAAFNSSKYSSLKEFVTAKGQIVASGANIKCGLTDPNETPQPIPDQIEWTHSDTEGFTSSHEGPCEAWCDDTKVFHDDDCAAHFTTAPAKMPFDQASCSGSSRLTFYWLALHSSTWQVYVNCAALEGGSASPSSNSTSSGSQSTTPTVTASAPSATTSTPSTTYLPTPAPIATTDAPVSGSIDDSECGSLDIAGSDESDCGSLDVAGSANSQIGGDADTADSDCGSLDIAGSDDSECGSLDVAGSDEAAPASESSLNFGNVDDSNYKSGKVQPQQQNL